MNTDRDNLTKKMFDNGVTMRRLTACYMQGATVGYLPPSQGELLLIVQEHQPISLKVLANVMQLTPGSISQLVEALEQSGYLRREQLAGDRRIINVVTTEAGDQKITALKQWRHDLTKQMTTVLDDDELRSMVNVQDKLIDYLKQRCQEKQIQSKAKKEQ